MEREVPSRGGGAQAVRARLKVARVVLWLIVAVLAVQQVAAVLGTPKADRLTDLETWIGPTASCM